MSRVKVVLVFLVLAALGFAIAVAYAAPPPQAHCGGPKKPCPTSTSSTTASTASTTSSTTTVSTSTTTASTTTTTTTTTTTPTGGDIYSQPVPRYGVSPGFTINGRTSVMQDWEIGRIKAVGAKLIRLDYLVGNTSWQFKNETVIDKALAAGLEVEVSVGGTSSGGYGSVSASTYGQRCSQAATKYHGRIRFYETFNEPNINGWSPSQFAPYQRACYSAIKAVDSRNVVLLGGISPSGNGSNSKGATYSPVSWTQGLYANGIKGSFDRMNVHLYGDPANPKTWSVWQQTFGPNVSPNVVSVMAANGDSKPVISSESGAQVGSVGCKAPDYSSTCTESDQASIVAAALRDSRVQQVDIYDMLNTVAGFGMMVPDSMGTILAPDGTWWRQRPSFGAYQAVAAP